MKLEGICFLTLNSVKHVELFIGSSDWLIGQKIFAIYLMLGAGLEGRLSWDYKAQSKEHIIEP